MKSIQFAILAILAAVAGVKAATDGTTEICQFICLHEEPVCPEGWYAYETGDCWTCCRDF
ncbi:hypothetical protein BD769DRAFT_1467561 [Suillus cothurnatus]|nr:hypothetical protein BD769DRAFT_1467561 [Suillus cothurnatus]